MIVELLLAGTFAQEPPAPPARVPPPDPVPAPVAPSAPRAVAPNPPAGMPEIKNVFLLGFDRNGDGFLSIDELPRRLQRKFAAADTNHDGMLDAAEILHDRGPIGKEARKADGLELDAAGKLVAAGAGQGGKPKFGEIAKAVLQQADTDGDGKVSPRELGAMFKNIILPHAREKLADALRGKKPDTEAPPEQGMEQGTALAPPAVAGKQAPEPRATAPLAKPVPPKKDDGYPTPAEIIAALDKDGDGMISESEAVDQLKKNFKTIDKNRDGKLDAAELEAAIRLAKLLGIKMDKPSSAYAPKK